MDTIEFRNLTLVRLSFVDMIKLMCGRELTRPGVKLAIRLDPAYDAFNPKARPPVETPRSTSESNNRTRNFIPETGGNTGSAPPPAPRKK